MVKFTPFQKAILYRLAITHRLTEKELLRQVLVQSIPESQHPEWYPALSLAGDLLALHRLVKVEKGCFGNTYIATARFKAIARARMNQHGQKQQFSARSRAAVAVLATAIFSQGCSTWTSIRPSDGIERYHLDGYQPSRIEQFVDEGQGKNVYRYCRGFECPQPTPKVMRVTPLLDPAPVAMPVVAPKPAPVATVASPVTAQALQQMLAQVIAPVIAQAASPAKAAEPKPAMQRSAPAPVYTSTPDTEKSVPVTPPARRVTPSSPQATASEPVSENAAVNATDAEAIKRYAVFFIKCGNTTLSGMDAQLLKNLKRYTNAIAHIRVVGRTDALGSLAINQKIARARAEAVVHQLERAGYGRQMIDIDIIPLVEDTPQAGTITNGVPTLKHLAARRAEIELTFK